MHKIAIWVPGAANIELDGTLCGKLTVQAFRQDESDESRYIVAVKEDAHRWYGGRASYGSKYAKMCWHVWKLRPDTSAREHHWIVKSVLKWDRDSFKELAVDMVKK